MTVEEGVALWIAALVVTVYCAWARSDYKQVIKPFLERLDRLAEESPEQAIYELNLYRRVNGKRDL